MLPLNLLTVRTNRIFTPLKTRQQVEPQFAAKLIGFALGLLLTSVVLLSLFIVQVCDYCWIGCVDGWMSVVVCLGVSAVKS